MKKTLHPKNYRPVVFQDLNNDFAFLVRAGKRLALLLRDDPERLSALLRKLEP